MGKSKRRKPNSLNPAKDAERPQEKIWVHTQRTIDDRGWMVTVDFSDSHTIALDPEETQTYFETVLAAAARAEYDAAVLAQLAERTDLQHAQITVMNLRADRPPLPVIQGWDFRGGVAARDRKGFVAAYFEGEEVFQMQVDAARGHAMHVREATIVADLDSGYRTALISTIGLDADTANAVVGNLAIHR